MRRQARRESSRAWIASGATVTIKTYARRYGVDRYTAYESSSCISTGDNGQIVLACERFES